MPLTAGVEVIPNWMSAGVCEQLQKASVEWIDVDLPGNRQPVREGDGGGAYSYQVADVRSQADDLYEQARQTAERVLREPIALSPFDELAVVMKRYPVGTGEQGWHTDTNGLTALLYLNDCPDGGITEVIDFNGDHQRIQPEQGKLLLMEGRRCWHCAHPAGSSTKEVLLFNLYRPGDQYRPAQTSSLILGQVPVGQVIKEG